MKLPTHLYLFINLWLHQWQRIAMQISDISIMDICDHAYRYSINLLIVHVLQFHSLNTRGQHIELRDTEHMATFLHWEPASINTRLKALDCNNQHALDVIRLHVTLLSFWLVIIQNQRLVKAGISAVFGALFLQFLSPLFKVSRIFVYSNYSKKRFLHYRASVLRTKTYIYDFEKALTLENPSRS